MTNPFDATGQRALTYIDVRPGYPEPILDQVFRGREGPCAVADIGAGTGKLTSQLNARGHEVWAVEPAADMRSAFVRALPTFPRDRLVGTTAEATGLSTGHVDVALFAQSWHWADSQRASVELSRILAPGGRVGILANQLDVTVPWIKRLTRIMRSGDVYRAAKPPMLSEAFTAPIFTQFSWIDRMTPRQLILLGTTRSSWLMSDQNNRQRMTKNLTLFLDSYGIGPDDLIELPYITMLWVSEKAEG